MTDFQRIFVVGTQAGADEVSRLRSLLRSGATVLTAPTAEAKRVVEGLGVEYRDVLTAAILVFATLGVYSVSGSVTEVLVMYGIGVLGFFMRRFDFPVAPVILGVILGPLMEAQFRRTLLVSDGDFGAFLERPFADVLFVLALLALVVPVAVSSVRRVRGLGEED